MPRRRVNRFSDLAAHLATMPAVAAHLDPPATPPPPPLNDGNTRTVGTTTGRIRTRPPTPEPPQAPVAPEVPAWSMSRAKGKMVLTVKRDNASPVHLYLTAREAVKLASHLLANAGSLMDEEELNRPPPRG